MSYIKNIFITLIISLLFSQSLQAEEITIYSVNNKRPKIWLDANDPENPQKGVLLDIFKHVANKMGAQVKIELLPWSRAYYNAKQGFGGIISISMTRERLHIFDYSDILYIDEIVFVTTKDNEFEYNNDLEDLKGKKIGVCRGCSYGNKFDDAKKYFTIIEDDSNIQRLDRILSGGIDAGIFNPGKVSLYSAISDAKGKFHKNQFRVLKNQFVKDPNYLAFAKHLKMKPFLKEFDKHLKTARDNREIEAIITDWQNNYLEE